jgi:DNA polymerase
MTPDSRQLLLEIIGDLRGNLELRSEWGVAGYAVAPDSLEPRPLAPGASGHPATLEEQEASCQGCTLCALHAGRSQTVFGVGSPRAEVVFVGEGPGREEDIQGEPFVGRAGQLLTRIIASMGLSRDDVYICNAVKCRPPGNRTPTVEEIATCRPYLEAQLAVIQPKVIVALGNPAVRALLNITKGISHLRGSFLEWQGIKVMPTFHPAYLLRNPKAKRQVWEDMKLVLGEIGRTPPARKRG